jgi:transposase
VARQRYSEECRREAVERYRTTPQGTVVGIAGDRGGMDTTFSAWLRAARPPASRHSNLHRFTRRVGGGPMTHCLSPRVQACRHPGGAGSPLAARGRRCPYVQEVGPAGDRSREPHGRPIPDVPLVPEVYYDAGLS